jgi:hypothetical protein
MSQFPKSGSCGLYLGIVFGVPILAAVLPLITSVLTLIALWVKIIWLIGYEGTRAVVTTGYALVTATTTESISCWALIFAQMALGALVGFAAGLRAQKPEVTR